MSPASSYLRSLNTASLTPEQFAEFTRLLGDETQAQHQIASVEYWLSAASPSPDQLLALAKSEVARRSPGILLLLKRYVRDQEYRASNVLAHEESISKWAPVRVFLWSLSSLS